MQFNNVFVIGIIVIGVIGTIVSVLTHTFKKDTVKWVQSSDQTLIKKKKKTVSKIKKKKI